MRTTRRSAWAGGDGKDGALEERDLGLRELYARYFFSVFDATVQQDEAGRRQAQAQLEDCLGRLVNPGRALREGTPEPA